MCLENLLTKSPYALSFSEKERMLTEILNERTKFHFQNCPEYARILSRLNYAPISLDSSNSPETEYPHHIFPNGTFSIGTLPIKNLPIENLPMLPISLFKYYDLYSVPRENIVKVLTSSGTSGQAVSKIFLDSQNVRTQTKVLNEIITSYIGKKRLPLLLLDTEMVKKDRSMYSARGAGIIGFSLFGKKITYALDENMRIDIPKVKACLEENQDETKLIFGYTAIIWQHIVKELALKGEKLPIKKALLFHIGGWKKLKDQAVDSITYNKKLQELFGNVTVHNYYGMVEQLGSVFVECEHGHIYYSTYLDILIHRPKDFSLANIHEKGLIQLFSVLPASYPGHSILTEDEGEILGIDDCPCGRLGKYFIIHGRVRNAEIRGCSDTYEHN